MWQSYNYKRGKLKLVKDLKNDSAYLRHSLIDIDEIENMSKIYNERKKHYHISSMPIQVAVSLPEESFQEVPNYLSPQERIELYRKQAQSNKLKDKYSNMFKTQEQRKYKLRNPVIHRLLESFKKKYKNQLESDFMEELKQSEKNLGLIKINGKRQFRHSDDEHHLQISRDRFLSLATSLPETDHEVFSTFQQFIKARYANKESKLSGINLKALESTIDGFFSNPKQQLEEVDNSGTSPKIHKTRERVKSENSAVNHETRSSAKHRRAQHESNPNRTFLRSEQSSRFVINTMGSFYEAKKAKKNQYNNMISFLKHDRPLTSQIRRKNYEIVGKQQMGEVDKYRSTAEQERVDLRHKNYEFYASLMTSLERCSQEDIPKTLTILQKLRQILQSEYSLKVADIRDILHSLRSQKDDSMTQPLIDAVNKFIGCGFVCGDFQPTE